MSNIKNKTLTGQVNKIFEEQEDDFTKTLVFLDENGVEVDQLEVMKSIALGYHGVKVDERNIYDNGTQESKAEIIIYPL